MKPSGSAEASLAASALVREFATTCAVLAHTLFPFYLVIFALLISTGEFMSHFGSNQLDAAHRQPFDLCDNPFNSM
jgi:hypothetical protein